MESEKEIERGKESQNGMPESVKNSSGPSASKKNRRVLVTSSGGHLNRLTKLYPKPEVGEEIHVTVLEVVHKQVGWSPENGKTVYIDEGMDASNLKRVRGVNEIRIFNWLSGTEGLIELGDEEAKSFRPLLKKEARLIYTRIKVKGKLKPHFAPDESEGSRPGLLSEKL